MKITGDSSGKTIIDFGDSILPDGRKITDLLQHGLANTLTSVLREFGIVGVVTYVGGILILVFFPSQADFSRQVLFAFAGMWLLSLSTLISYFRIKANSEKEKALIEMTQNTGNRLAEQLGKSMTNEQVVSVTQTIWQNQKDLIFAIFNPDKSKRDL